MKGHIKKAISLGASRQEISEAICIAVGVNAASVVDQTDIANLEVDFITMLEETEKKQTKAAPKRSTKRKSRKK